MQASPLVIDILILVSIIYDLFILFTGGFSLEVSGLHFSSSGLRNPLIITGILFLIRHFLNRDRKPFLLLTRERLRHICAIIANRKIISFSIFIIAAILVSYHFTDLRFRMTREFKLATAWSLLNHSAATPWQYRILIPWLVHFFSEASLLTTTRLFRLFELFSVFFLVVAFRYYLSLFFSSKTISSLLSFALFYVLPFNFLLDPTFKLWYPWDMSSMLFFTLGLILLYKKNWVAYYPLFVVATLNRETTVFLTFIYLFTAIGKSRPKSIVLHCVSQAIIWVAIKYSLFQLYSYSYGHGLWEGQVPRNIQVLTSLKYYPYLFSNIGFLWIPALFYFRLIRDDFVKRSLLVVFPFVAVIAYTSNIDELRGYQELIPVILIAFLLIMRELLKREPATS